MISMPIAVCAGNFWLQLDLFWFQHKKIYGYNATRKALALIVNKNYPTDIKQEKLPWDIDVPYAMVDSCFEFLNFEKLEDTTLVPLNIQSALIQVLNNFDDDEVIEVLDCDMFYLKKHPELNVKDEIIVSDVYENWHLKSLTNHKWVIDPFLSQNHGKYNGGFVPIIGKAKTFKKIAVDWLQLHKKIFQSTTSPDFKWWSGMYSLQVACANNHVEMRNEDLVYCPGYNELKPWHYISHYCCDTKFNKKIIWKIDDVSTEKFDDNVFYNAVVDWLKARKQTYGHI
jgi:hypothetical protein